MAHLLEICVDLTAATKVREPVRQGLGLLVILIAVLGAFFLGVVLLTVLRRRRTSRDAAQTARQHSRSTSGTPDPWYEAGRRIRNDKPEKD